VNLCAFFVISVVKFTTEAAEIGTQRAQKQTLFGVFLIKLTFETASLTLTDLIIAVNKEQVVYWSPA
jgi:hypothetical protein